MNGTQHYVDSLSPANSIADINEQLDIVVNTLREISKDMYRRANVVYAYVEVETAANTLHVVNMKLKRLDATQRTA